MSVFISICFLLQVLTEGFGQVYSGLVGQTDKDPHRISKAKKLIVVGNN